jgi:hypothetical protein
MDLKVRYEIEFPYGMILRKKQDLPQRNQAKK